MPKWNLPRHYFLLPSLRRKQLAAEVLGSCGITHARTGYNYKEDTWADWRPTETTEPKPKPSYYDPKTPLLTRSTGIANCMTTSISLGMSRCRGSQSCFTFHGSQEENLLEDFEKIIKYIVDNNLKQLTLEI